MKTPYGELPFNADEASRSLDVVSGLHGVNFQLEVERVIARTGICRLLDVGCGNSTFGSELAARNDALQVFEVDLYSDEERQFERPQLPNTCFEVADGGNLQFPDEGLDIIVATWSVSRYGSEYTDADNSYVTEFGRLLSPWGAAFITPEISKTLGTFGLKRCIEDPYFSESMRTKAAHYKALVDQGFDVRFREEPSRAVIFGPRYQS